MSLLVVLPVCAKDLHLACRNIDYAISLDGRVDYPCLIVHERDLDIGSMLPELCQRFFSKVDIFVMDKWTGDQSWPVPQNIMWGGTARYIEQKKTPAPWFWWEPDATPLKPQWLSTLLTAHQQGGQPFSGAVANQLGYHYIAGVAIYPPNISSYCQAALLTRSQPWDIVASTRDGVIRKSHDLSSLIHHTVEPGGVHFDTMDDVHRTISESAVLFHKCKDGSLLDVLQGKTGLVTPMGTIPAPSSALPSHIPSFTEQTKWPSGYFTFPAATNTAYFNCSIVEHNSQLHLFTRRWRYNLEQITGGALQGNRSDLAIWRVRDNLSLEPTPRLPNMPTRYPHEQWEDPRAMVGEDGHIYLSFATWVHHKSWAIRQSFAKLTPDWRKVEPLWESPYGGNNRRPESGKNHEKNWIWFEHESRWHCCYSINPGDYFRVDAQGTPIEDWQTRDVKLPWTHGLPLRGGTPPTRIGDEYVAFFHTSTVWQKPKRRYYMGAYTFDAFPPFALRRVTPEPLLIGSEHDFRALSGPLVVFPNGAVLRTINGKDEWLVVFGVNDEACGWIRIPHEDLEDRLVEVKRSVIDKIANAFA